MARDLFCIERRPAFESILDCHRGARVLAAQLAERSLESEFSVEAHLAVFAEHPDPLIRRHFLDIPPYLCDVIASCMRYTSSAGCYLHLVQTLLTQPSHHVCFLTLNYDTFLEDALSLVDGRFRFDNIGQYINNDRQAVVIKAHGSITWYAELSRPLGDVLPGHHDVPSFDVRQMPTHIHPPANRPSRYYPVLTAPLGAKTEAHLVCPTQHVTALLQSLPVTRKLLMIGTSGLDTHVLNILDRGMPKLEIVHVVAMNDAPVVRERFQTAAPRCAGVRTTTYSQGFRAYLRSDEYQQFLNW